MKKLIFVYNANSGLMSATIDALHKTFRPSTYQCQLCALTYGMTGMKGEWKKFVEGLPYEAEFLHKDEFEEQYPGHQLAAPSAHCYVHGQLDELISAKDFDSFDTLEELKQATLTAMAKLDEM